MNNPKKIALNTVLFTIFFFGITYLLLVITRRTGKIPYLLAGLFLLGLGIYLFIISQKMKTNNFWSNLLAIISGIFLWRFFGEFLENADLFIRDATVEIAHRNFLPVLGLMIFLFLNLRKHLQIPVQFSLSSFLLIWSMHYIMIFQYEMLSRTHFTTYISMWDFRNFNRVFNL